MKWASRGSPEAIWKLRVQHLSKLIGTCLVVVGESVVSKILLG